ncbi:MAG: 30S ribosomal protein S11 [Patescibacteria group bacterium]
MPEEKNTKKAVKTSAPEAQSVASVDATTDTKEVKKRSKKKKTVSNGKIFVQATYNNTVITIADEDGNTLCWSTSGASGFKGTRKSTPYAAQVATENAMEKARTFGMERAHVYVKGPGNGRDPAMRAIAQSGIEIESITDMTPIAHNGCRPRKRRRV